MKTMNKSLISESFVPSLPNLLPVLPDSTPLESSTSESLSPTIPIPEPQITPFHVKSLRCGCYLLNYQPNGSPLMTYDGTMRVECHSDGRTASGDLYQRPTIILPLPGFPPQPILLPGPNPAQGIPILSRNRYRYYLRVTQILESITFQKHFTLGFELYRFAAPNTWTE
jgi:hypothetical protein